MSNEEMNRKMEFIVEQQAKFAAEIEITREIQAQDAKLFKEQDRKIADALIGLVDIVGYLTRAQTGADARINLLAEAQTRTDEGINRLTEAGTRTDARLNILINVVDRHITGNGGPHNHAP
jgi:DNA-directed RNA polymerase specialized sigma54-like protein